MIEQKKEIQEKIIKEESKKVTEEEFLNVLKLIAPGTHLRTAIDSILKGKRGAIIAVENQDLYSIIDGGFRINTRFTPQKLTELSKMDGALVISEDIKKINFANVLLTPDSRIKTEETGTRHKAAERTAKHAGTLVVAISERKNDITLFYKNIRYPLVSTGDILLKVNERMQMLEKQRELFDIHIGKLDLMELRNYPSLNQSVSVIQKGLLIQKISQSLQKYVIELGKEGFLIKTRLKELTKGVEKETDLVIKDYTNFNFKHSKKLFEGLQYEDLFNIEHLLEILGFENNSMPLTIKGWRILNKTNLLDVEIANLIKEAGSLGKAMNSNSYFYKTILGEEKARVFQEELNKLKINNLMS